STSRRRKAAPVGHLSVQLVRVEENEPGSGRLAPATTPGAGVAAALARRLQPMLAGPGGVESTRYLSKWLGLGTAIGVVAGLGAIAFSLAIEFATHLFLGDLVGYLPPAPVGEGEPLLRPFERPWLLPLVVALGGLISGLIVFALAPEAEGHGTDAAIDA